MSTLKTNYKDDILDTSVNTQRKYRMVNNADGTISLEDVTVYTQNGDTFGASEVNQIHAAVNLVNESLTVDTTDLSDDFSVNALLQMLAEKYFPNYDGTLYASGKEYESITGGWSDNGYTIHSSIPLSGSYSSLESGLVVTVSDTSARYGKVVGTNNAIDLSSYSKLECELIANGETHNIDIDITSLNGEYYISFAVDRNGYDGKVLYYLYVSNSKKFVGDTNMVAQNNVVFSSNVTNYLSPRITSIKLSN